MTTPPTAQLINGPTVILTGPAILEVSALIEAGIRYVQARDAIPPSPGLLTTAALLRRAAQQYRATTPTPDAGHDARTSGRVEALSAQHIDDGPHMITAREAGDLLMLSERHVRRLAQQGQLLIIRTGPLMFDRGQVLAFKARRDDEWSKTA